MKILRRWHNWRDKIARDACPCHVTSEAEYRHALRYRWVRSQALANMWPPKNGCTCYTTINDHEVIGVELATPEQRKHLPPAELQMLLDSQNPLWQIIATLKALLSDPMLQRHPADARIVDIRKRVKEALALCQDALIDYRFAKSESDRDALLKCVAREATEKLKG